jgi:hypothetical protein
LGQKGFREVSSELALEEDEVFICGFQIEFEDEEWLRWLTAWGCRYSS